jgi:uncharacterized protein
MKKLVFVVLTALQTLVAFGQKNTATDTIATDKPFATVINLQAVYRGDSVVLRWVPETPGAWREANKAGYVVSRATLNEDGSFDPATFLNLTAEPIKPWPLEKWATIAGQNSTDDFAKIAAQTLYGKSMVPTKGFIGQADEFVTRFSFGVLAADMSPPAARAMGLRFADHTAQKGQSYIYRVTSPVDTAKYTLGAGVTIVNTQQAQIIPHVVVDHMKESENMIELFWKRDFHNPYFSAYYIERSDDNGKNFKRLNSSPYVHAVSERIPVTAEFMVYIDSVKLNYKKYSYRIIGITPFGELAPASPPIAAMGRDKTPPQAPLNVKAKHMGGSSVKITWEYPKQAKDIKGFLIGRGNNPTKKFIPLTLEPLPSKTREFIDDKVDVMASNYYIVAAVDTAGNASVSLAQYAMIIDSLPPAPPTGLVGKIDTTGIVTVSWKLGTEKDIKGYLVFFSNHADHEFSQLTHRPVQDTVFQDTITLKTLTKKIYYRVVAIDYNSNYSKFSEILELKRPDIIPPTAAVLDRYKITETGIQLFWVSSSSEDLAKTVLYRSDGQGKTWSPIATFPVKNNAQTYTDTTALHAGDMYSYSLVSFDEDGLQSKRSVPIKLKYPDLKIYQAVTVIDARALVAEKSILVSWNYPVKGDYRFILYRAVNGSAFTSYKSINGSATTFQDKELKKGSSYEYSIGVVFKNGKKAPYGRIAKTVF